MRLAFVFKDVEMYLSSLTEREKKKYEKLIFDIRANFYAVEATKGHPYFSEREKNCLLIALTYSLLELHSYISRERDVLGKDVLIEVYPNSVMDDIDWDKAGRA